MTEALVDPTLNGSQVPGQRIESPVSPAVGGPSAPAELQAPTHSPDLLTAGDQPALPGMEPGLRERLKARGHEATVGLGRAALRPLVGSAPVKAVRGFSRAVSDVTVGASAEVTDTTRARGSSRARQLGALGHVVKAGLGTILEDRSLGKVDKYARRVVKNAGKLEQRGQQALAHHKVAVKAVHGASYGSAVGNMTKAAYDSVRASYSDWRVGRNAGKLAKHAPKLDRRSAAVSGSIDRAVAIEERGNRRRERAGVGRMSSALDHDYIAERRARAASVDQGRKRAEAVVASRR